MIQPYCDGDQCILAYDVHETHPPQKVFDKCWTGTSWDSVAARAMHFADPAEALAYLDEHRAEMESQLAVNVE